MARFESKSNKFEIKIKEQYGWEQMWGGLTFHGDSIIEIPLRSTQDLHDLKHLIDSALRRVT